ncbi:hypothetical protein ILYODFUR_021522 [Ilyodon furcidens]|uniref:Uncharacterized protein n=1 Tax=Ilyodon furcidens TaxID=33524 RepID=A0ABV0SQC5_9TELE
MRHAGDGKKSLFSTGFIILGDVRATTSVEPCMFNCAAQPVNSPQNGRPQHGGGEALTYTTSKKAKSLIYRVFLSTVATCMLSMRDCCKVNASDCPLSLHAHPGGVNAASH